VYVSATGMLNWRSSFGKIKGKKKKKERKKACLALLEDLQQISTFPFFEYFGNT